MWGAEQEHAFEKLREVLCRTPVSKLTDLQWHFVVGTDACVKTTVAVSLQEYDDELHPVAFHFLKYSLAKFNYGAGDKELLAIIQVFQNGVATSRDCLL